MTRGKQTHARAQTVKLPFIMQTAVVICVLIRVVRRAHFGLSAKDAAHVESLQSRRAVSRAQLSLCKLLHHFSPRFVPTCHRGRRPLPSDDHRHQRE